MLNEKVLNNKFIKEWLAFSGGSETPFIMNLWTMISGVSACLGRRNKLIIGRQTFYPNMYVLLVGPPAVRKSTSASLIENILKEYTELKFGPTDTAGKKQGVITSFFNHYEKPRLEAMLEEKQKEATGGLDSSIFEGETNEAEKAKAAIQNAFSKAKEKRKEKKPNSELFIIADELINFIGQNQVEMIGMLTEIFNPKSTYEYSLAKETKFIYRPCLNLLGCATPTGLATHLPPSSIGSGFSSRVIMVYEGKAAKKIYPVPPLNKDLEASIGHKLATLSEWEYDFDANDDVVDLIGSIYNTYVPNINDSRFLAYENRRLDHLHKLAMVLAACEERTTVTKLDIIDAHRILEETEKGMKHALGEIGMDKISLAKQRFKELLDNSWPLGVSISAVRGDMLRDMNSNEFNNTMEEFISRGYCIKEIKEHKTAKGSIDVPMLIPAMPIEKKKDRTSKTILDSLMTEKAFSKEKD